MAYNTKKIPVDAGNLPISSNYNAAADEHQPTEGAGNAPRVRIADGNDATLGSRADAASSGDLSGEFTIMALLKEGISKWRSLT